MNTTIRLCTPADLPALRELAYTTFADTFRGDNTPEDFERYAAQAFDPARLAAELDQAHSDFFFIYMAGTLAGYLKLNWAEAQTDAADPAALEIERIYVARAFQGRGLGRALVEHALSAARAGGFPRVWLGVWEHNQPAIAFYQRMGFRKTGEHPFQLGSAAQTDWVMTLALDGQAHTQLG